MMEAVVFVMPIIMDRFQPNPLFPSLDKYWRMD